MPTTTMKTTRAKATTQEKPSMNGSKTDPDAALPTRTGGEAMMSPYKIRLFLELISGIAEDLAKEMDDIEKLVERAEKQAGPSAQLFVMPSQRDAVQ